MRRVSLITRICYLALVAPCLAAARAGDIGSRLDGFRAEEGAIISAASDEDDWSDHRTALEVAYERWFPEALLGPLTKNAEKRELTNLFFETLGYAMDVGKSEQGKVAVVFAALEEKGWADDRLTGYMHRLLLTFRRFDEAKAFRQSHPQQGLPAAPPIIPLSSTSGDDVRTVLRFINNGSALEREAVDWQSSSKVIVIGHPECHFSRDAVAAIASDPELAKAMSTVAIWLTPAFTSLTDGSVVVWNKENPTYAYRYVESDADWPEVNYWGTPSFYFIKQGELVKKVVGWPEDGRTDELWAGLRAIGLEAE
ncbi:MAG TPA: hypothetical protein VF200_01490 [Woeseiaceae bacterium]